MQSRSSSCPTEVSPQLPYQVFDVIIMQWRGLLLGAHVCYGPQLIRLSEGSPPWQAPVRWDVPYQLWQVLLLVQEPRITVL